MSDTLLKTLVHLSNAGAEVYFRRSEYPSDAVEIHVAYGNYHGIQRFEKYTIESPRADEIAAHALLNLSERLNQMNFADRHAKRKPREYTPVKYYEESSEIPETFLTEKEEI